MFERGISAETKQLLNLLRNEEFVSNYFLAGGTALALRLGHRISVDLDFFSQEPVNPAVIVDRLQHLGKLTIFQNDQGTFNGSLNGVKLSFFIFPYPNIRESDEYMGVKIASIEDIACMKLEAIGSRGVKRDFVDMFFIAKQYGLNQVLDWFREKYVDQDIQLAHVVRSLVYFDDADKDEMPRMLVETDWEEIKLFFQDQVKKLMKELKLGVDLR